MARTLSFAQRAERSLLTDFRKPIYRPFMQAVRRYGLIRAGDRIAVCVSGGKDSMLLAKLMQVLQRHSEVPFEAVYLAMDPGYLPEHRRALEDNARLLDIPLAVFDSDVFDAVQGQDGNPCFLCARMRRGCLYRTAQEMGCNRIALGHHFNDVIETTLISMLYGGQLQGMLPKRAADNFPGMGLIRPLYLVHEEDIAAWRDALGLQFPGCACRLREQGGRARGGESMRQSVKALIARLKEENPNVERNLFGSIHTVQLDTLPGWKHRGEAHSFLEETDGP